MKILIFLLISITAAAQTQVNISGDFQLPPNLVGGGVSIAHYTPCSFTAGGIEYRYLGGYGVTQQMGSFIGFFVRHRKYLPEPVQGRTLFFASIGMLAARDKANSRGWYYGFGIRHHIVQHAYVDVRMQQVLTAGVGYSITLNK